MFQWVALHQACNLNLLSANQKPVKQKQMALVNIDELTAGMVLASDLKGSGGRMLLPQGVELQNSHIKTLKAWGVQDVDIQFDSTAETEETESISAITAEHLEQSRNYLGPFFQQSNNEHPAIKELLDLTSRKTAEKLAQGQTLPQLPWENPQLNFDPQLSKDFRQRQPKQPETLLRGRIELASLPDVYSQIVEVMNSPRSSAADLAEMISKDTSLSSRMLKLVNSAFYGFPSRIDSISRAVTLIGTNELTTMALGISVISAFKDIPCELMSMEGFWRHSIACGVFARLLAAQKVGTSAEQLFVGGLLHDIGRMVMLKQIPQAYTEIIREARKTRQTLVATERTWLGYDHTEVGRLLCQEWRFSKALEEMVSCHHLPGQSRYAPHVCIIQLADILAKAYFIGQGECGCVMIGQLQEKVWQTIDIDISRLSALLTQADLQIKEVINLFLEMEE